jgi:predicted dehydrogenase
MSSFNRRQFLAAAGGLAGAAALSAQDVKPVRVGLVGVGNRGGSLLRTLLNLPGVEVPAICDINEEKLARAVSRVTEAGRAKPVGYSGGTEDFRKLVERDDLDAVINATPWHWHTPIAVAAMEAGKYAATEVPAATSIEECWQLVETSERTGMPCMMLENVNYFRNALAVLNMVQQGLLGEIIHCEGGYQHDVRRALIDEHGDLKWRGVYQVERRGNDYPTHPMGPMAWWSDINRGDRFSYLTSMSSKSRGMNNYVRKLAGPDHPNATRKFAKGDINTTMLRTENGVTMTLYYDTVLPRAYDLILRVQGTEGIYSGTLDKIYIEDVSPKAHEWESMDSYYERYDHPLYKALKDGAEGMGHGGADYITLHQFLRAVRKGTQTPIDVWESATWSAIMPLSERSVDGRSAPVDFPDFTKGRWQQKRPLDIGLD